MKYEVLAVLGFILLEWSGMVNAQTTIRLIDFESAEGYSTSVPEFTDNTTDYFLRTNGSNITGEQFTNIQGEYFFGAQDIDGEGASLPVNLFVEDIDISGYSSLLFRVYLAEDPTGNSEDWDAPDYVHFTYRIDDGNNSDLLWIETLGDSTNGPPGIDTDFDGNGDGTEITGTFTQFEFSVSGSGSLLDLQIEFNLNAGDEDIAIDNIEILGTASGLPKAIISGDSGWRLISIPKVNASGSDIADDGIGAQFTNNTDSATIYTYDESGSYAPLSSAEEVIEPGTGLALYLFDNTLNGSSTLPLSLDASGNEPSGDVEVPLNITNAISTSFFTLLGNPYGSNYDLSTLTFSNGSIQNNIHLLSEGLYSPVDRNSTIITPWQAFWVEGASTNVDSLTFPASGKTTNSSTISALSKQQEKKAEVVITLQGEEVLSDAVKITFKKDAIEGWDLYDASKLQPLSSQYATIAIAGIRKGQDLFKSVESLPLGLESVVKLEISNYMMNSSGFFTLDWQGIESIPTGWSLTLYDHQEGIKLNMDEFRTYSFESTVNQILKESPNLPFLLSGPAIDVEKLKSVENRFSILINPLTSSTTVRQNDKATSMELEQNYPNPFNPGTTIKYNVIRTSMVKLKVYNAKGQEVTKLVSQIKTPGSYQVYWDASAFASGIYYYRLETDDRIVSRKMTLIK